MSNSPETHATAEEELPLTTIPGTGDALNNDNCDEVVICSAGQDAGPFCKDEHHRKLAICSIICGISCIGITALIYSVKAEMSSDREAAGFSQKAKKFSIISIATFVAILVLIPSLMGLISFLLTLQD